MNISNSFYSAWVGDFPHPHSLLISEEWVKIQKRQVTMSWCHMTKMSKSLIVLLSLWLSSTLLHSTFLHLFSTSLYYCSCLNKVLFAKRERATTNSSFLSFHSSVFDTSQSVQAVLWVHVARASHTYIVADILLFLSNNSSLPFNSSFSLSYFCSFLLLKSIFQLKKEKSL